ncbi:phytoene dehydrogenase-like protein [Leptospira ellinghausenii]|uniref:Phytoene dehydrogenase-like protein n=1 Tax=Leptospira ellinghausenii TaxID=1917822 RepID=A0A2P2D832_9LEPT|nr:NAD(P)/FAD-dependent oxidoreductase [Leptospira ellinghausenii]GBF40797.1 phytoene dehydrogenase-like protein [Leptospira ellinghausenii]
MEKEWDVIVLGSGLGGLSAALSFANKGKRVLVLEKSISPGGSASSFWKNGYLFESGATTLVGFEPGLPMDRLTKELGIQFPILPIDRSMVVHLCGKTIERYKDRTLWIKEAKRMFGGGLRMVLFWKLCFFLSDQLWSLSARYKWFPFQNLREVFISLKKFRPYDLIVFLFSLVSVRFVQKLFWLHKNEEWNQFLNEQLLITNQSVSNNAPFAMAAAGLTYPNLQNYIVSGGMLELSQTLIKRLRELGGEFLPKQEVSHLTKKVWENLSEHFNQERLGGRYYFPSNPKTIWEVKTKNIDHSVFCAPILVSNLPIWNLVTMTKSLPKLENKANGMEKGIWGAFTMGIAIQVGSLEHSLQKECLHHQIHLESPLPHGGGRSVFVSISHPEDKLRSKDGIRILSVSTHLENPENWKRDKDYQIRKKEIESVILSALEKNFDWFKLTNIQFYHSATPVTWQTWTGRKWGRVGGIPSVYFFNPFRMVSNRSEDPSLLLTGDTVYPGQGIPAVVLGGLNAVEQYESRKFG